MHDIGKNIVAVVMACNGYAIVDLGVMVPAETIVQRAIEEGLINIIGGCCGTTDAYIAEYPALVEGAKPVSYTHLVSSRSNIAARLP